MPRHTKRQNARHRTTRRRTRAPFGRFVNHVNVKPSVTELTLALGHYHGGESSEPVEWRVDEVERFTLPYASAKVMLFNLLASITAFEHKAGHVVVPAGIRPGMPAPEHVGLAGAARLEQAHAELFGQPHSAVATEAAGSAQTPVIVKH